MSRSYLRSSQRYRKTYKCVSHCFARQIIRKILMIADKMPFVFKPGISASASDTARHADKMIMIV